MIRKLNELGLRLYNILEKKTDEYVFQFIVFLKIVEMILFTLQLAPGTWLEDCAEKQNIVAKCLTESMHNVCIVYNGDCEHNHTFSNYNHQ